MKIKNMSRNFLRGECILVIVSLLWGSSFMFQKKGMDYVGPFTLGAYRFLIGAMIILPVVLFRLRKKKSTNNHCEKNYHLIKKLIRKIKIIFY